MLLVDEHSKRINISFLFINFFLFRLLEYFGELFPASECKRIKKTVCDNCRQVLKTTTINCTQMSIDIIKLVAEFSHKNITLPYALEILRGANTKNIRDAGHNNLAAYNSCNQISKNGKYH
jgi:superfamily II DNA helicase RecQ